MGWFQLALYSRLKVLQILKSINLMSTSQHLRIAGRRKTRVQNKPYLYRSVDLSQIRMVWWVCVTRNRIFSKQSAHQSNNYTNAIYRERIHRCYANMPFPGNWHEPQRPNQIKKLHWNQWKNDEGVIVKMKLEIDTLKWIVILCACQRLEKTVDLSTTK